MSRLTWIQRVYWTRFSKPVAERELVRHILSNPIASLLEVGIGDGSRLRRLSQIIQLAPNADKLRYVGVDEFEASATGRPHMSLKSAHQLASQLDYKATLIPGQIANAITRVAHKIGVSDLIIIDGGMDPIQPQNSPIYDWFNRIAHEGTTVFACAKPGQPMQIVKHNSTTKVHRVAA